MLTIRPMDRVADRAAVEGLDTSFTTSTIFDVVVTAQRIDLVERVLAVPMVKRYPMADAFSSWASWEHGFVADVDGGVGGFAAVEYSFWHKRLILWHLYVAPAHRREGIAGALLAHIEAFGRQLGARRVWLETSNVNVPGIAAYERLGYALCGVDESFYEGTDAEGESAIYLHKAL